MAGTGGARFKAGASHVLGDPTCSVTNFDKVCFKKMQRESEREREREKERERETDRQTDRDRGRET